MKHFTLLILLLISSTLVAQHNTCDDNRYINQVFDDISITSDVKFGENTTVGGVFQELYMDVYEPADDSAEMRPVIIWAFGGAFVAGERQTMAFLCEDFARRGFVAATIDYRLVDAFSLDSALVYDAVVRAISDMAASVRYFREDAATNNQFRIDPDAIFAGGISAGAITAAHLAYLSEEDEYIPLIEELLEQHGGFAGNSSDNLEYSSAVQGVVNYSGALKDAQWIDANDPPCFSVHDDGDMVVPYGKGFSSAFPFGNYLEGSLEMTNRMDELGITNELITFEDSDEHVSFFNPSSANISAGEEVVERSALFLHNLLCTTTTNTETFTPLEQVNVYPNPSTGLVGLRIPTTLSENFQVQVFDYMGRLVHQATNSKQLDLSHLPKGMYQLTIRTKARDVLAVQKLILH